MRPHPCDAFNIEHGMEQTSMTNAIKKRLNKKGFTLAEVLVTVAIILILAGVTFVSVAQYQKNLRLMEMDGTAKEIFIAAQNHLSVAKASGDLDRLAEDAKESGSTPASSIGTKLEPAPAYAGNSDGEYYYVIHNVNSGSENYTPTEGKQILEMMLPFGALDETVATSGNYAIVYERKSASVVAVLYSGAGNASFGNAAVINLEDNDVNAIPTLYNDKSARKSYQKEDVTAIVGCYTGTAGSAAIPTETLEAPKLEVKNENKLHVIVSDTDETAGTDNVTLIIRGVQSGTVAQRLLQRDTSDGHIGAGAFDVTIDDITGDDGSYRFANIISPDRFTLTTGTAFIPGENIEISARVSSTTGLATPKESAKYTVSSLFGDVNETKDAAGNTTVYIRNLRHLENLGANVSGFTAALGTGTTSGSSKIVNIIAEQKNDITMFSMSTSGVSSGNHFENLYGSKIYGMEKEATFAAIDVNYPLVYHGNQHEIHDVSIGAQNGRTAAGIFGKVTDPESSSVDASLSVRDLILRNDRVSGTNVQNAGMLVGETTKDLTVDGVLAYYHEDTYNETRDSNVEVTASENAGGLIGLVAGGKLDVKNSAAAVYVKGGKAAGGFIGSVNGAAEGSTIVQSYAGGHTKDGAYSTTDETTNKPVLDGPGRYNVQASGYAGGFIGESSDKVTMNAVYSTASAYSSSGDANSNSFAGSGTLNIKETSDGKKNYYAIGPHNGTDASTDDTAKAEIQTGQVRRQATPYDRKLLKDDASEPTMKKMTYPLCTISHLCSDTNLPWFSKEHVGDWVMSKKTTGKLEIKNDVRLELDFTTEDTSTKTIFFTITGATSKKTLKLMIDVTVDNGDNIQYETHVEQKGAFNIYYSTGNKKVTVRKTEDGKAYKFIFYLDDITTDGGHFATITDKSGLILGEDLNITVSECTIQNYAVTNIKQIAEEKVNSLFDHVDLTTGTAYISSARHLENLDQFISGINVQPSVDIKNAVIMNDILWKQELNGNDAGEAGFVEKIKTTTIESAYKDTATVRCWNQAPPCGKDACYVPITNDNLQVMNGQYENDVHKLINFDMYWNNVDNRHCGLFRKVNQKLTIENLKLRHVQSESASDAFTGALVGTVDNQAATVNVYNVHVEGKCVINGGAGAAGGLIGHTNGAVSVMQSDIANAIVTSTGNSGGLIGETGDGVTNIKEVSCDGEMSVKGKNASGGIIGQTNQAKVTVDTAKFLSKVEVTSDNTHAGGVIGISGGEAEIKNMTFKGVLTVSGANSSGGIIGNANGKATVDKATFESDVTVKATSANVHAGGIVGYAAGEADIKNATFKGRLTVSGNNSSAGIIGNANANAKTTVKHASFQSDVTVTSSNDHAAGVLGITNKEADIDIENITFVKKLIVYGNKSSGGILGSTGSKLKLCDISIGGGSTITSVNGDAGGVAGYAQSYDADIQNIKFIGKDTKDTKDTQDAEVIAKGNAGGLCGVLIENNKLTISNVAVSAFIQAEQNAGGLIGRLQTSASEGKIKKSYYGGRTKEGQYASITINNNAKEYTSNIHGSQKAGGLIGSIENSHGLTISECFSTGSVGNGANNPNAGGFIGAAEKTGVKIKNCYSIGKVGSQNNGGFIGFRNDSSNLTYENAYYLNTFNDPLVKAIGNGTEEENNTLTTKYADDVLGKNETSDQTVQTNSYDDALNGEMYPYKNWTTDWEVDGATATTPIAYYGDWPLPSKLAGELIYFSAKNDKNYKKGGLYKVTGQNTNVECYMTPIGDLTLEKYGFGIISEYPITDQSIYDMLKKRYAWSNSLDGEFKDCKIEGSAEKPEYSVFTYFGKKYYYYRCTSNGGLNIPSGSIYVKDTKANPVITYQVSVSNGEAQFTVVSGG